jgi:hypothetical protein
MPRLSEFYGIVIYMYWRDHPPPHFHAIYGDHEAVLLIEDGSVYAGELPRTALQLVRQWASEHRDELFVNWKRATRHEALSTIEPLA